MMSHFWKPVAAAVLTLAFAGTAAAQSSVLPLPPAKSASAEQSLKRQCGADGVKRCDALEQSRRQSCQPVKAQCMKVCDRAEATCELECSDRLKRCEGNAVEEAKTCRQTCK